jgi:hypothetical protein
MLLKFSNEGLFFDSWEKLVPSVRTGTEPKEPEPKFVGSYPGTEPNGP